MYSRQVGWVHILKWVVFVQEADDETAENTLVAHPDGDMELSGPWDAINTAALRKLLLQLDAEDR